MSYWSKFCCFQLIKAAPFRPEDTHKGQSAVREADLNLVYWGGGECQVQARIVQGKCRVVCDNELPDSDQDWFPDDCFYFREAYDSATRSFIDPPSQARSRNKGKVRSYHCCSSLVEQFGGRMRGGISFFKGS